MQDRYAGDVGDFGKFSLLNYLFNEEAYRIGVVWYLVPDENHNNDGGHIDYLQEQEFLDCDNELCAKLKRVVKGKTRSAVKLKKKRSVAALQEAEVLPEGTVYFPERLNFYQMPPHGNPQEVRNNRVQHREQWLDNALQHIAGCNVAFLDPDNGMEVPSCPNMGRLRAGKYAFYDELAQFVEATDVTVIYQHMGMNNSHEEQIEDRLDALYQLFNHEKAIFALRFRPYSPRAYFIVANNAQRRIIRARLHEFQNGPCGQFWDTYRALHE